MLDAIRWIEEYADSYNVSYDEIMATAQSHLTEGWGDYITGGAEMEGEYTSSEFWDKFEIVTGQKVETRHNFFSCSC